MHTNICKGRQYRGTTFVHSRSQTYPVCTAVSSAFCNGNSRNNLRTISVLSFLIQNHSASIRSLASVIQFQSYLLPVSIRGAFQPVDILLWRDNRHTPLCHNLSLCSMITKRPQFVKEFLLFMAVCRYRQEFRHPHTAHDHSQNQMLQTPEIRSVLPDPQVFPSALPESC